MTNLQKILIGTGIIGIGVISTPIIYSSQINKFINQEKQILKQNNISVKDKKNNDSFFKTDRKYYITIKDSSYIIKKLYPNISTYDLLELKNLFDNMKFLVTLKIVKFPIYHKDAIKIDLIDVNETIKQSLMRDKIGKKLLEAIQKRVFEIILDINNLKIAKTKLKDINLDLKENGFYSNDELKLKVKDSSINFEDSSLKIGEFEIAANEFFKNSKHKSISKIEIKNLIYKVKNAKNLKNNSSKLSINSLAVYNTNYYKETEININNISIENSIQTIIDKTNWINKFHIKNMDIKLDNKNIKIDNFTFNFKILNIYTLALQNFIKAETENNQEKIIESINKISEKGIKISISPLSVDNITISDNKNKLEIEPIKIDVNTEIKPNNSTLYNYNQLLADTKTKLKIETTPKNIDFFKTLLPVGAILDNIAKKQNNKIIINLEYRNGQLTSNGRPIL